MSKPVIKKPEMPNRDIVERSAYIISGDNRHSTELSYQAGIDYCYKEMLGQFRDFTFQGETWEDTEEGKLMDFHRDFTREEIEALSQLEEDNK